MDDLHETLRDGHHAEAIPADEGRLRRSREGHHGDRDKAVCEHHSDPREPKLHNLSRRDEAIDGVPDARHGPDHHQLRQEVQGQNLSQRPGRRDLCPGELRSGRVPRPHFELRLRPDASDIGTEPRPDQRRGDAHRGRQELDIDDFGHWPGHVRFHDERHLLTVPRERRDSVRGRHHRGHGAVGDGLGDRPRALVRLEDSRLGFLLPAGDLAWGYPEVGVPKHLRVHAGRLRVLHRHAPRPRRTVVHRRPRGHHRSRPVRAHRRLRPRVRARFHRRLGALPGERAGLRVAKVGALCRWHIDRPSGHPVD
mmetsp:Transcript_12832/g.34752  ORF Transcript_12832/g.34752 Transcript_12832/m.34752 type:complete len:309 (+) Transcript_12832:1028-1954(+)